MILFVIFCWALSAGHPWIAVWLVVYWYVE